MLLCLIKKLIEELRIFFSGLSAKRAVIERERSQIINATALWYPANHHPPSPCLCPVYIYRPSPAPLRPRQTAVPTASLFIQHRPIRRPTTDGSVLSRMSPLICIYTERTHSQRLWASEYPVSTCRVCGEYATSSRRVRSRAHPKAILFSKLCVERQQGWNDFCKIVVKCRVCSAVRVCRGSWICRSEQSDRERSQAAIWYDKHAKLMPLVISMPKVNRQVHVVVVLRGNWFPGGQVWQDHSWTCRSQLHFAW